MLNRNEILETIEMLDNQNLDVRTITMAISLYDCVGATGKKTAEKIYDKITTKAGNLVKTGNDIAAEYGVPIVNKRVSVTPISQIGASHRNYTELARALDRAADAIGVDFVGGYSAMVQKGIAPWEEDFLRSIPEAVSLTGKLCSSVNIGSTKAGINMDAVVILGRVIKELAYLTREKQSIGCAKFVAFCNAVDDNPFMAGAFNGAGEGDCVINVGVSGPGVVKEAVARHKGASIGEIAEVIKKTAFKITRVGQLVATAAAERLKASFGIIDLSLAPTPKMGDSVAHILEEIGLESVGAHGTTAVLALLNDAVKKGGIMASSSVGGLSGAFIPVSEDIGMIRAAEKGYLTFDKLEAMTAVCSVGLDMIAVPGDTTAEVISAIIADEAAIGMVNNKTTAVRLIPAYGKKVGDSVEFGGLLGSAPIIKLSELKPDVFIQRGGRIPAPIHSNKN